MEFVRLITRATTALASLVTLTGGLASAQPTAFFAATIRTAAGGALVLQWPSESGQHHHIESSPDLTTWTAEPGSFTGTGAELTSSVRAAGTVDPARQFWRVGADDAPPINLSLVAHRTTGVAPLSVFFDATSPRTLGAVAQ